MSIDPRYLDRIVRLYNEELRYVQGDETMAIRNLSKRIDKMALGARAWEPASDVLKWALGVDTKRVRR